MKAPIYTQDGKENGTTDLPAALFEAEIKTQLVHQALVRQHANARVAACAHTLRRGEVRGTTAKAYRQKGTGNARMGAKTSPIRRGGGVAWGPRNDRNFTQMLPKKMKKGALASCLSSKAADGKIAVLESFTLDVPKAKDFLKMKAGLPENRSVLIVHDRNETLAKSSRNIKYVKPLVIDVLNVHDLTKYDLILIEKSALARAESIWKMEAKKEAPAVKAETKKEAVAA